MGTFKNQQNPIEFMNSPSSAASTEIQEKDEQREQEVGKHEILVSSLRIKTPSRGEIKKDREDEDEDGFRTPTCLEQRIPLVPQCPPAPRKPKSTPSRKRKWAFGGGIILDSSSEVEALFPASSLVADLGGKVKKVRKVN
ncbi:cyclin-dependent protein kinase inhibitor SMR10-like [Rhododendron vialii]|uniref:cyclin-dependent protein kinase inhibitor SMR10-like n=1 Tax=Rhododendron vialii TaxID=182163 RepID=UPI00265DDF95|nr:cyclin-dependent protein kinase inhibitor SMR10-like [Rhododendron vialii]